MCRIDSRCAAAAIAAVAFLASAASPAAAQSSAVTVVEGKIRVDPNDSAKEVYARIRAKARRLCRTDTVRPYDKLALERACGEEFIRDAIAQLGRVDLAELHEAKGRAKRG